MLRKQLIYQVENELEIIDINSMGMGVAKDDSGAVYFIKETIPGDVVNINEYKKKETILRLRQLLF